MPVVSRTGNKQPKPRVSNFHPPLEGDEIPSWAKINGGGFDPELYRRLEHMQSADSIVKEEARRYLRQGMEASTRLLADAHMSTRGATETATLAEQEQMLLNEAAMEVMAKFLECQDAIDRWHRLLLVVTEMRRRR